MSQIRRAVVVGAGINGLVAANVLARAGWSVTHIERLRQPGGACVNATAVVDGIRQDYALGASVLGLMQDFVWQETGLDRLLTAWAPTHPKLIFFPGESEPTWIHRDAEQLDREFRDKWGERGDLEAFRADEARVVDFLQSGYRQARPPTIAEAETALGREQAQLWISGSARELLEHYLTAEGTRMYMAMTVTESGPVSLDEPYSAFTIPLMDSGSVFGGYYGFVKGGIWQITRTLNDINRELGVDVRLGCPVSNIDTVACQVHFEEGSVEYDELLLATDPVTAARLTGDDDLQAQTAGERTLGSAGKLNLMFRNPVRWKHGTDQADSDAAFRFLFGVDNLADFEAATMAVTESGNDFSPGYFQVYCEGAAMRHMGLVERFDRLAVFFKNLALGKPGEDLPEVRDDVTQRILALVDNPEDLAWSRLLTPRDLQTNFGFPGGNLEHTMLVGGQQYHDRGYAKAPQGRFYRFGAFENISLCGSAAYPCGSVTGTTGWMCAQELLRETS